MVYEGCPTARLVLVSGKFTVVSCNRYFNQTYIVLVYGDLDLGKADCSLPRWYGLKKDAGNRSRSIQLETICSSFGSELIISYV